MLEQLDFMFLVFDHTILELFNVIKRVFGLRGNCRRKWQSWMLKNL